MAARSRGMPLRFHIHRHPSVCFEHAQSRNLSLAPAADHPPVNPHVDEEPIDRLGFRQLPLALRALHGVTPINKFCDRTCYGYEKGQSLAGFCYGCESVPIRSLFDRRRRYLGPIRHRALPGPNSPVGSSRSTRCRRGQRRGRSSQMSTTARMPGRAIGSRPTR
jgi:hypothetical protein